MKCNARTAAVISTLLMSFAFLTSGNCAQEPPVQTLPEVKVTSEPEVRHYPGDSTFSDDRLPGCVEVITPRGGGGLGGSFQSRFGRPSISVIPDLNRPSTASQWNQKETYVQAIPAGYVSPVPQCQFGGPLPKERRGER